jgi:hypothetical protein
MDFWIFRKYFAAINSSKQIIIVICGAAHVLLQISEFLHYQIWFFFYILFNINISYTRNFFFPLIVIWICTMYVVVVVVAQYPKSDFSRYTNAKFRAYEIINLFNKHEVSDFCKWSTVSIIIFGYFLYTVSLWIRFWQLKN